jgi:hypothetical protein
MAEPPFMQPQYDIPGVTDYTDPKAADQKKAELDLRDKRLRATEAAILSTPEGREWLWGLMASLHVHEVRVAVTGSEFENGMWMGEYAAGNRILRRFASVDPQNFSLMFFENDRSAG